MKKYKFIKSIQEEATNLIMLNNINSFLKDGKKELEELLANLIKHNHINQIDYQYKNNNNVILIFESSSYL